jgi:hypothetical protein
MAFKYTNTRGATYFLHSKTTEMKSGNKRTLYFFSKVQEGGLDKVPEGYQVSESPNGLPVLKKANKDTK